MEMAGKGQASMKPVNGFKPLSWGGEVIGSETLMFVYKLSAIRTEESQMDQA